jgi:hypothetical protein
LHELCFEFAPVVATQWNFTTTCQANHLAGIFLLQASCSSGDGIILVDPPLPPPPFSYQAFELVTRFLLPAVPQ